jgi:uncharacterized membrane protein YeaQ/YmgE (transglycosylase-associated protein family)
MLAEMPDKSLFALAVTGLLAGVLARALVGRRQSLFASLGFGLLGALGGAAAAGLLGLPTDSPPTFLIAALAGATLLLSIYALVVRR